MRQLDTDAFVVGAFVIERIGQMTQHGFAHFEGRRKTCGFDRAGVLAHHLLVFDVFRRHARLGSAGHRRRGSRQLPDPQKNHEHEQRDHGRAQIEMRGFHVP